LKNNQNPNYTLFKRKIYLKIALIAVIALVTVFLLRYIASSNNMGDVIVSVLRKYFNVSYDNAHLFYWNVIRRNLDYITFASVAVFFIILSRSLLSQFSKYFHEISNGLDTLVEDKDIEIKLSPEMVSMESKLKIIKQTLKEREQEARLSEQRKNDIVTYLAHDIKTPLTSVIGYLSLLDEAPDMPLEQKVKYIHIGLEKAYRLESLINELFEITQYNLQTLSLSKEEIDLCYMLVQMVDEVYPQLAAHGKKADINAAEDLTVYGDPDKLARAFNNILKNAIAYGEDNSVIDITANIKNNLVVIEFRNSGSIPKDKLLTIFDKFYRLNEARSSDTGGAGLGLAIAKEIFDLHGGNIKAESESGYTIFTVELPAYEV
jgi:two-component system sensor histidine kinase VanS